MDAHVSENANVTFSKFHPKFKFIDLLLFTIRNIMFVWDTFPTFQYLFETSLSLI